MKTLSDKIKSRIGDTGWIYHEDIERDVEESIKKVRSRLNKMWKDIANFEKYTDKILCEEFGDALVLESEK